MTPEELEEVLPVEAFLLRAALQVVQEGLPEELLEGFLGGLMEGFLGELLAVL